MRRAVLHLLVGEAEGSQSGRHMSLIAAPVSGLLRGRAVIAESVCFDNEPQFSVEEVHLETVQPQSGFRLRQPNTPCQREEIALELGVGKNERAPVEQIPQGPNTGSPGELLEPTPQRDQIDQLELVCGVHRRLQLS